MRRIAVDAMGTDSAPEAELEGAIQAARAGFAEVLLVGPEDRLRQELAKRDARGLPIEIVHASKAVTMDDKATKVLRQRHDYSIESFTNVRIEPAVCDSVKPGQRTR